MIIAWSSQATFMKSVLSADRACSCLGAGSEEQAGEAEMAVIDRRVSSAGDDFSLVSAGSDGESSLLQTRTGSFACIST